MAAPTFAFIFFYGMGGLQGKGHKECWQELKKKFPAVYLVGSLFKYFVYSSPTLSLVKLFQNAFEIQSISAKFKHVRSHSLPRLYLKM